MGRSSCIGLLTESLIIAHIAPVFSDFEALTNHLTGLGVFIIFTSLNKLEFKILSEIGGFPIERV